MPSDIKTPFDEDIARVEAWLNEMYCARRDYINMNNLNKLDESKKDDKKTVKNA